jgi:hypothetical protein
MQKLETHIKTPLKHYQNNHPQFAKQKNVRAVLCVHLWEFGGINSDTLFLAL